MAAENQGSTPDGAAKTETAESVVTPEAEKTEEQKETTAPAPEAVKPAEEPEKKEAPKPEEKADKDEDDEDLELLDEETPLSYRQAKKVRNENRNLREAKKALATENETLTGEVTNLKAKVAEYETQLKDYQKKTKEAERTQAVKTVQAKHGLSDAQAKLLKGDTLEELEATADEFVKAFGIRRQFNADKLQNGHGLTPADISSLSKEERMKQVLQPYGSY